MNIATQLDRETLAEVVAESLARITPDTKDGKRWTNAIAKAVVEIENNPYLTWQANSYSLLMLSQTSGEIYTANGTCQCAAFAQGMPCYHRAAARLVARYLERVQ